MLRFQYNEWFKSGITKWGIFSAKSGYFYYAIHRGDPVTSIKQLYAYAVAAELDWSEIGHTALGMVGIVWDGADLINAAWYCHEENYEMAAVSVLCALPFVGTLVGGSAGMALKVIGKGFTLGFAAESTFESISRAVDAYKNGTLSWWNALDVGFNTLGFGLAARGFKGTFGDALAGKTEPGILSRIKPMNHGGYFNPDALRITKPRNNILTVDDLINDSLKGRTTKGRTIQYERIGNYQDAVNDFNNLQPQNIKEISNGKGYVGQLLDGRIINVRNISSEGSPTIEIQNGKNKIKFRYKEFK